MSVCHLCFVFVLMLTLKTSLAELVPESQCTTIAIKNIIVGMVYQKNTEADLPTLMANLTGPNNVNFVGLEKDSTTCYRVLWRLILIDNGDMMAIYDQAVLKSLYEVDILMGEYMKAIAGFAESVHKTYLITSPAEIAREVSQRLRLAPINYMANMWPPAHSFLEAIHIYAHLFATKALSKDRIVILHHSESVHGLQFVSLMTSKLSDSTDRPVDVVELDKHLVNLISMRANNSHEPLPIDQERSYKQLLKELRDMVATHHTKLVVLYLDGSPMLKRAIYKTLFSKTADLERKGVPWVIADMFFAYKPEEVHELEEIELVKASVHMFVQTRIADCLRANTVIERGTIWAHDVIIDRLGQLNGTEAFTSDNFRKKVFAETEDIYGVSLNEHGERVKNIMFLMKVLPHGFDSTPKCGNKMTGMFAYNDVILVLTHDDISLRRREFTYKQSGDVMFYGARPASEQKHKAILVKDAPFVTGNAEEGYEGIAIDIFEKTKQIMLRQGVMLDLEYEEDTSYGMLQDGNWTGALGRLASDDAEAVISLGQFSRTSEREDSFLFTTTYGYIQTTFIVQKREGYFYMQFARPFAKGVWGCLMLTMVISAAYVWGLDAWNPFKDEVAPELRFNEKESIWFSFLTIFQVGAPFGPYMFATRVFSVFYWFFAMVVVACYTGNLASFLSDEEMIRPDVNLNNLLSSRFRFGMLNQSSVEAEFKNHHKAYYNKIHEKVKERNDFVTSYAEGMDRVMNEKFLLIGTSGVLNYYKSQDEGCTLITDNEPSYTKATTEIAFPMRMSWSLAESFDEALQELRESGEMQSIYRRWMKPDMMCEKEEDETTRLGFKNFLGLYIILITMVIVSFICLVFKLGHLWLRDKYNKKKDAKSPEETEMLNVNGGGKNADDGQPTEDLEVWTLRG